MKGYTANDTRGNLHAYRAKTTRSRTVWTNTLTESSPCMSHRVKTGWYGRTVKRKKNWNGV